MKWIIIVFCFALLGSCSSNRYFTKIKGFRAGSSIYIIKQARQDSLKLLIFYHGIPHYSYFKIYADNSGNVFKIIHERDSESFYEAITNCKDNINYFGERIVNTKDSCAVGHKNVEIFDKGDYEKIIKSKFAFSIKLPTIIGWAKVERPKDHIDVFDFRSYLKQKKKIDSH